MGLLELFILAVGLSMEAFAVSVCKGLSVTKMEPKHAFLERHVFLRSISNKNNLKAAVWRLFLLGHEIFHINYITNKTIKEKECAARRN